MARLLLLFTFLSFTIPASDIKHLLCEKKWYAAYGKKNERFFRIPENVPVANRPWIYFYADGRMEGRMNQKLTTGHWSINEEKRELTTTEDRPDTIKSKLKLIRLTVDTLELLTPDSILLGMRAVTEKVQDNQ